MKRKILTVCLIVVLTLAVVCVSACTDKVAEELRVINTLLRRDYSKTEIHVTTVCDGITLEGYYTLTLNGEITNIEYSIDRLNEFDVNGSVVTAPAEFVSRYSGSATFDGDRITSINGDHVEEEILMDIADTNMTFRVAYFNQIRRSKTSFKANVVNPQGFLGDDTFDGTDMTVNVQYGKTSLNSIVINYTDVDGASVVITYSFTR